MNVTEQTEGGVTKFYSCATVSHCEMKYSMRCGKLVYLMHTLMGMMW